MFRHYFRLEVFNGAGVVDTGPLSRLRLVLMSTQMTAMDEVSVIHKGSREQARSSRKVRPVVNLAEIGASDVSMNVSSRDLVWLPGMSDNEDW